VPLFLTAEDGEEGPMGPPGTGSGSGGVGTYFDPVTWNGSTDRALGVGQITQDSFTSATSMPLHIACGDGQIYEIEIAGRYTPAAASSFSTLQPNNTGPATNSFDLNDIQSIGVTVSGIDAPAAGTGGFRLETVGASIISCKATVFTSTLNKKIIAVSASSTSTSHAVATITSVWNDTTTVWSSLGTITMPNAWTGTIVVRRIA